MLITSLLFTLSSAHSTRCDRTRDQQEEEVQASCQFTDEDPHRFFGTKTTYTNAFNHLKTNAKNVSIPESCSPVMVYVFKRHAIRYPERNDILVMNKVLGDIRDYILDAATTGSVNMCQKDIESLQNWTLNMKPEDDNSITESGFKETESIAKRLRERYYRLFDPKLRIFDVTVSKRKRTSETAHSFLDEIKRFYGYKDQFNPKIHDVSDFHSLCEHHLLKQGVKLSKPSIIGDFIGGDSMRLVRERVSRRIGLNYTLAWKEIKTIYRGCSFGYAIHGDDSWCALFSKEDLKVLEYYEDLDDYYADGYGRNINTLAPCLMTMDLIDKIKDAVNTVGTGKTGTYLRFSHAGAMKQLVSHFGLFNDFSPPVIVQRTEKEGRCVPNSQINQFGNSRQWRSSLIAPFSCNFQFVLYHCHDENSSSDEKLSKYHLVTFLQEFPVILNGCDGELCPLKQFLNQYLSLPSTRGLACNLEEICRI